MKKTATLFLLTFMFSGIIFSQEKSTLNIKDLNSDIEKYIKKNYEGFTITEAFKYDLIYEVKVLKQGVSESLVFDSKENFLYKKTEADKAKVKMQTRTTLSVDDVESDIQKYVKKNFEGSKISEAYKYDEVYLTKITKGGESETLVFDKDGKFVKKVTAASAPSANAQLKDSIPAEPAMKSDSLKTDTVK